MIIRDEIISSKNISCLENKHWQNAVFFDIETTGLGWRSSHIYLIGILYRNKTEWILRQWFLDRPFAEKELLTGFSVFLQQLEEPFLVDYNGDTFDLPYLRNKFKYYKIPLPKSLMPDTAETDLFEKHIDLLRLIRPLKSRLPISSLRLQDVEELLHAKRTDSASGKELIDIYYQYLQTGETTLLEQLFLHNRDDVSGLPQIVPLLTFTDFWKGSFQIIDAETFRDHMRFRLKSDVPFPVSCTIKGSGIAGAVSCHNDMNTKNCSLSFESENAILTLPVEDGERKLFFKDFRNYYYLPGEDQAIHKSVGIYTDPSYRVQAKAATCYQRADGRFVAFPSDPGVPGLHCFYSEYKDKTAWVRTEDLLSCDPGSLHTCIQCILEGFF